MDVLLALQVFMTGLLRACTSAPHDLSFFS